MKKNKNTDMIALNKIVEYTGDLRECFNQYNITSSNALKYSKFPQYIATQVITNIYELKKLLQSDTLNCLTKFNAIKIEKTHNIASHNYESIEPVIVYSIVKKLTSDDTINELNSQIENLKAVSKDDSQLYH